MPTSHLVFDHALFILLVVVTPVVDFYWLYPRLIRKTRAGVPGARMHAYVAGMVAQGTLTLCVITLWTSRHRPWSALWVGTSTPLRLGLGLVMAALAVSLLLQQRRTVLARPELLQRVRLQLTAAGPLLPHTDPEHRGFMLLSITAGICEEFLFRGFVLWYVGAWTGLTAAAAITTILFGAAHLYLSRRDALRAGAVGAVMAVLVIATRSLFPAMILHAAIDMNSGDLAFHALRQVES